MTTLALKTDSQIRPVPGFQAADWRAYFEENQKSRPIPVRPDSIAVSPVLVAPLVASLKRFQLGETGGGHHLRAYASRLADEDYLACVDMFVREEQSHAQALGTVILTLKGTLLTWHWSDLAFSSLRHLSGLKTELMILLIAEIIGKCYYRLLSSKIDNEALSEIFSLIVLDELAHLEFHTAFLKDRLKGYPAFLRKTVRAGWRLIFEVARFVFLKDHAELLRAVDISEDQFTAIARQNFKACCDKVLGPQST
ncbi:MAG: hypothetical protein IPM23_05100 [Candidatus Melainabacteria bacterium]|nr:hypothetical protein [Candidatus Melainabacteria bacterium]